MSVENPDKTRQSRPMVGPGIHPTSMKSTANNVAPVGSLAYQVFEPENLLPKQEAFERMPFDIAKEYGVFPLDHLEGRLLVVTDKPGDIHFLQQLECIVGMQIEFAQAELSVIEEALSKAEGKVDQLSRMTVDFLADDIDFDAGDKDTGKDDELGPIVRFINTTIKTALNKRASDIHIESYEHSVKVKYRIDGQLYPATEALDIKYHSAFVSRLKVMAELDIAEKRTPQDGRFKLQVGNREIDFRISVLPSIHGENVVIRILDSKGVSRDVNGLSLDSLGISAGQHDAFLKAVNEPYGMVLITGPTGSGKTTTLYSALKDTYSSGEKVITIEDPVEYQLDGITQIPVNAKKGLTFAKGLRSILRHDPDRILVGEIRDAETADIAVQSALTGHLVLSSVHANNAIDVLSRLQNMGVNVANAIGAINAVMAQRLIRVLCCSCKKELDEFPTDLLSHVDKHAHSATRVYQAVGCPECDYTGYTGRTVISELLLFNEEMKSKALSNQAISEVLSKAEYVNGETLRKVAVDKCMKGITSVEEVNRVTFA